MNIQRGQVRSPHEDAPVCVCGVLTCITVRAFGWLPRLFKFGSMILLLRCLGLSDGSSVVVCDCVGRVVPDVSGGCIVCIFSILGLFDPYVRGHNAQSKRQ